MLVRLRWFLYGMLVTLAAVTYMASQVRRARERLTPRNLARSGAGGLADWLDATADRIAPPAAS